MADGTGCTDGERCTINDACAAGVCAGERITIPYGDIDASGIVELGDLLCLLAGYNELTSCPSGDIHPCGGDGLVELGDLLADLNAYSDLPAPCPAPCP